MSASENPIPNVTKHSSSTTLKLFGFPITPASNKRFKCNFCSREFANHQALGGHQNAHKRERQKAKLAQFRDLIPHHQRFTVPSPIHHPIMVAAHATPGSSSPFVHDHPRGSPAAWDPQPLLSMIPDEEELDQLHILTPSGAAAGTAKPEGPFIEVHHYVDGDVDLNLNPAVIPSNSKDKDSDRRS